MLYYLSLAIIVRVLAKTFFGEEYKSSCYARSGMQWFIIEESFDSSKKPLFTFSSLAVVDEVYSSHEPFHPIYFQPQRKTSYENQKSCFNTEAEGFVRMLKGTSRGGSTSFEESKTSNSKNLYRSHLIRNQNLFKSHAYINWPKFLRSRWSVCRAAECGRLRLSACLWWISVARACLLSFFISNV